MLNAAILLKFDPPDFVIASRASCWLYGSIVLVTTSCDVIQIHVLCAEVAWYELTIYLDLRSGRV